MPVSINAIKCPECGASLEIEEGRSELFCSYCGTKILIKDENEYTYRYIDEAGIRRSDNDTRVRMRELDIEDRKLSVNSGLSHTLFVIWLVISLVIILVILFEWVVLDDFINAFFMLFYLAAPIIGGGAFLVFKVVPDKEHEKALKRSGAIKFPKNVMPFEDKNYESVRSVLSGAGFCNIKCVNMHDLTLGLLKKPGMIESVTIDGENEIEEGHYYMPDVPITITYHGK